MGSIDSNTGSPDLGWDTDQFPMDIKNCTLVMKVRGKANQQITATTTSNRSSNNFRDGLLRGGGGGGVEDFEKKTHFLQHHK